MKTVKQRLVLVSFGLLATTAYADLIPLGETATGADSSASAEIAQACAEWGGDFCDMEQDFRHIYPDANPMNAGGAGTGAASFGDYIVGDFTGEPAFSLVSWDLVDPAGYGLFAIAVKTGQFINWYGLTDDMLVSGTDMQVFTHASEIKGSISHISFFVQQFNGGNGNDVCPPGTSGTPPGPCVPDPQPIPEPGTLALLGLGILGLGLRRRSRA